MCGVPSYGTNTQLVPQVSLSYQDTYNYSCLTGYETNDDITTECLANGSMSLDGAPACSSEYNVHYNFRIVLCWSKQSIFLKSFPYQSALIKHPIRKLNAQLFKKMKNLIVCF